MRVRYFWILFVSIVFMGVQMALAEEIAKLDEEKLLRNEINLPAIFDQKGITVIGSKKSEQNLPGSAHFLGGGEIEEAAFGNVHEILRKVPGVYVRDEEGFGLFPNISLRGVDPGRSGKVTIMEDGILAAPAPYSAPSAYYSPNAGRMAGIEVLKGSSQIKYGPHTTGGVINYLSTPIPTHAKYYLSSPFAVGSLLPAHGHFGNTVQTRGGNFGYLLEYYFQQTAGFKSIDATADFANADNTGFKRNEPMLKLSWEPNTNNYQRWEAMIGASDVDADETYLGLVESDFAANPYRRYAASRFDNFLANHTRSYFRYLTEVNPETKVTTTLYSNRFHRNWFKLNGSGANLANPATRAIWQGTAAGTFNVRNNNRDYYGYGAQSVVTRNIYTGAGAHELDLGVRYHIDQEKRVQNDVRYTQDASGVITGQTTTAIGSAGNRELNSHALSLFVSDKIQGGKWEVTPGIRYESISYDYRDFDTTGADPNQVTGSGVSQLSVLAPGISAQYRFTPVVSLFGGIHRGYSVPGPRDNARSNLKEEISLGTELGMRLNTPGGIKSEAVLFNTAFNDLLVVNNIGGGGTGTSQNVGNVNAFGIELATELDAGQIFDRGFKNPYRFSATYTNARIIGAANSTDVESIFAGAVDGARVPYIPLLQFSAGTGLEFDAWGVDLDANYQSMTFTTASNATAQVQPDGTPNENFGTTDERLIMDVSGFYKLAPDAKLFAKVHNLFDRSYVVSRHPIGARPGKPRTVAFGVALDI